MTRASAAATALQVLVDFSATWCGPCRMISPYFEEQAAKFPNVKFIKVDVDTLEVPPPPAFPAMHVPSAAPRLLQQLCLWPRDDVWCKVIDSLSQNQVGH